MSMPVLNGIDVVRLLKVKAGRVKVVFIMAQAIRFMCERHAGPGTSHIPQGRLRKKWDRHARLVKRQVLYHSQGQGFVESM